MFFVNLMELEKKSTSKILHKVHLKKKRKSLTSKKTKRKVGDNELKFFFPNMREQRSSMYKFRQESDSKSLL